MRKVLLSAAVLCLIAPAAVKAQPAGMEMFSGRCEDSSHTAEGPIGADLTQRQSRFYCNFAVVSGKGDHLLIQFVEKQSNQANAIIGFAGGPIQADSEGGGVVMPISRIYVTGKETPVDDGNCKFFLKNETVTDLFCGAKVDATNQRRFVAIVGFNVVSQIKNK